MRHVSSIAAHSASVDISHSGRILHLLVHCSVIHFRSGYELDVSGNITCTADKVICCTIFLLLVKYRTTPLW